MRQGFLLLLYCMCLCAPAGAKGRRRAVRSYQAALRYYAAGLDDKAFIKMQQAIAYAPADAAAYSELGRWYFEQHRFGEAAGVFRNAAAHCPGGPKQFARPLAKSLIYSGLADSALGLIYHYQTVRDSAAWTQLLAQAYFVRQALAPLPPAMPVKLGPGVNTADAELYPAMSADTGTLYFTRRQRSADEDMYTAKADSGGEWQQAVNMGSPPNSPDRELAQSVSADGHYLFFTRCENRSEDGWEAGGCDLYMAYRIRPDTDWTVAQAFGVTINTPAYEGMPCLSPDNRELYFVSDRKGGYGGQDIWVSRFDEGVWQLPVNAGPAINTPGDESAPYISMDNQTLYFTSDGLPGMGGTDLYMARKAAHGKWGKAVNLGYPVNTACNEKSACAGPAGRELYFASDRDGPAGNYDIFRTPLPRGMQPVPVGCLAGYIYDSISKERLNYAAINIISMATGDTLYTLRSNRGDASYLITLPVNATYIIHTSRVEHDNVQDTLAMDTTALKTPVAHNVAMIPSGYVFIKPVNDSMIATIHFDRNKAELSDSDKAAISAALAPWADEKGISIYINGYTDNTGTPMLNEELSQKRAAIVSAQVSAVSGLPDVLITATGWGEAKMIAPNDTEDNQKKNRRVEIIIKR